MNRFYVFSWPFCCIGPYFYPDSADEMDRLNRRHKKLDWAARVRSEIIKCPVVESHIHMGDRLSPLVVDLPSSRDVADFEWSTFSECILTPRVRTLLSDAKTTGVEYLPATIRRIRGGVVVSRMKGWEVRVVGRAGHLLPGSRVQVRTICDVCGLQDVDIHGTGYLIDAEAWDGSDVFTVGELPRYIFVGERAAQVIIEAKFVNCQLIPAAEYTEYKLIPLNRAEAEERMWRPT